MAPVPDSPGDEVPVHEEYRDRDQKNHKGDYTGSCHLSLESRDERTPPYRSPTPSLHTSCEKARYCETELDTGSHRHGSTLRTTLPASL